MARFQPTRRQAFGALLDVIDAYHTPRHRPLRLLDLGGGAGSWSAHVLEHRPDAHVTLADLDPVLLALARAGLKGRVEIADVDLRTPEWTAALPHQEYDVVVAVNALHHLSEARLAALYGETAQVLAPSGLLLNTDRMPEDGVPSLTASLDQHEAWRRAADVGDGAIPSWESWWQELEADPELSPLCEVRATLFGDHTAPEWAPPVCWHIDALRAAGYAEAGQAWRHGAHAAVAAIGKQ